MQIMIPQSLAVPRRRAQLTGCCGKRRSCAADAAAPHPSAHGGPSGASPASGQAAPADQAEREQQAIGSKRCDERDRDQLSEGPPSGAAGVGQSARCPPAVPIWMRRPAKDAQRAHPTVGGMCELHTHRFGRVQQRHRPVGPGVPVREAKAGIVLTRRGHRGKDHHELPWCTAPADHTTHSVTTKPQWLKAATRLSMTQHSRQRG